MGRAAVPINGRLKMRGYAPHRSVGHGVVMGDQYRMVVPVMC